MTQNPDKYLTNPRKFDCKKYCEKTGEPLTEHFAFSLRALVNELNINIISFVGAPFDWYTANLIFAQLANIDADQKSRKFDTGLRRVEFSRYVTTHFCQRSQVKEEPKRIQINWVSQWPDLNAKDIGGIELHIVRKKTPDSSLFSMSEIKNPSVTASSQSGPSSNVVAPDAPGTLIKPRTAAAGVSSTSGAPSSAAAPFLGKSPDWTERRNELLASDSVRGRSLSPSSADFLNSIDFKPLGEDIFPPDSKSPPPSSWSASPKDLYLPTGQALKDLVFGSGAQKTPPQSSLSALPSSEDLRRKRSQSPPSRDFSQRARPDDSKSEEELSAIMTRLTPAPNSDDEYGFWIKTPENETITTKLFYL